MGSLAVGEEKFFFFIFLYLNSHMNFVYLYIFLINMKRKESKTLPVAVGKVLKSSVINTIQYNSFKRNAGM